MVGKRFVSVAHNFENENLLYFMVVEGKLVSLVDEMCLFKEIKPRADLPHEPTTLPDLIICLSATLPVVFDTRCPKANRS